MNARDGSSVSIEPVTVLVVDDQEVFRRAARGLVEATPGFVLAGEAASGPEALELVAALDPELVLIDVRMPGMDGMETARLLAQTDAHAVVVLTSIEDIPGLPSSAAAPGVEAFVRKQELTTDALREIWAAHGDRAG